MQALKIDPDAVTARADLGEAYAQKKDLAGAQGPLEEIQQRCGTACESDTLLAAANSEFQTAP